MVEIDAKILGAPGRYIQGYKELENLCKHTSWMGERFLIIISPNGRKRFEQTVRNSFKDSKCELVFADFGGECTKKEIARIAAIRDENKCDVVIGMGGGKILDTARAVAIPTGLPVVLVPTAASNDASTSAQSAVYHEDHRLDEILVYHRNPDMVLVDTHVIANAPARFLIAGIGDALSTFPGARVCVENYRRNYLGGYFTQTSYAIAKLCHQIVMDYGYQARLAVERKQVTKALENVIEAVILLSGIGFESNGIAADHAILFGFAELTHREHVLHGEYVAFCTMAMLVLEGRPREELDEMMRLCLKLGLPMTLADLNMADITEDELKIVGEGTCKIGSTAHNEPFKVTPDEVVAAIKATDAIGQDYKKGIYWL
ncbi:MAG: glycerol dehydrogenase [Dethiobacteria bacterium]|jgi:glycerol dehydrogenase|nr:glycerol dehydrogenase [Bacillota bacterium]